MSDEERREERRGRRALAPLEEESGSRRRRRHRRHGDDEADDGEGGEGETREERRARKEREREERRARRRARGQGDEAEEGEDDDGDGDGRRHRSGRRRRGRRGERDEGDEGEEGGAGEAEDDDEGGAVEVKGDEDEGEDDSAEARRRRRKERKGRRRRRRDGGGDDDDEEEQGLDARPGAPSVLRDDDEPPVPAMGPCGGVCNGCLEVWDGFARSVATVVNYVAGFTACGVCDARGVNELMAEPDWVDPKGLRREIEQHDTPLVMQVKVRGCDAPLMDPYVLHPVVRVHVVDATTGRYLAKENPKRGVTSAHEAGTLALPAPGAGAAGQKLSSVYVNHVLPMMTSGSQIARGRVIESDAAPQWDEDLIFDQKYAEFLRPEVLLLFEVLDFGATLPEARLREGDGLYRVAWGFLRPVASDGSANVDVPKAGVENAVDGESPISKRLPIKMYRYQPISWADRRAHAAPPAAVPEGTANCCTSVCTCSAPRAQVPKSVVPSPEVFMQYRKRTRVSAPFALNVSVSAVPRPEKAVVTRRPVHAREVEARALTVADLERGTVARAEEGGENGAGGAAAEGDAADKSGAEGGDDQLRPAGRYARRALRRQRAPNEACRPPNVLVRRLFAGTEGAMVVSFSPDGRYLAAGCVDDVVFPVRLFSVASGTQRASLEGHGSIIYDLAWSPDSRTLLSSSADGTVRAWRVPRDPAAKPYLSALIRHAPVMYVYAARFHPRQTELVVTGGFDSSVRLWTLGDDFTVEASRRGRASASVARGASVSRRKSTSRSRAAAGGGGSDEEKADGEDTRVTIAELMGPLGHSGRGHTGNVNALCFSKHGDRLFSGCSDGIICVWDSGARPRNPRSYTHKTIATDSLEGKPITALNINPNNPGQLYVSAHQNFLRRFDLRTYQPGLSYTGMVIRSSPVRFAVSPDGTWVLCGSEDGEATLWEADTSKKVALSETEDVFVGYSDRLMDVAWHPTEHLVALCSYGTDRPVLLFANEDSAAMAAGAAAGDGADRV